MHRTERVELTILRFSTKFAQKGYFLSKADENTTIEYPKRVFKVKKRKSERHLWILDIRFSLVTKNITFTCVNGRYLLC